MLTRRTNAYVSLEERTAIANKSGADLFLSIHVNASANQAARGFETYFLNFAPNPEAEALAARENAGSAKTMSSLPDIVKAIALNNKIDESRDFASMVQKSLQERLRKADPGARNLGVKQAPFMVLIGATMPSVLVEVSFLTNRNEATLLRSDSHRRHLAEALWAGIMNYQQLAQEDARLEVGVLGRAGVSAPFRLYACPRMQASALRTEKGRRSRPRGQLEPRSPRIEGSGRPDQIRGECDRSPWRGSLRHARVGSR